jgi:hypothetical protein
LACILFGTSCSDDQDPNGPGSKKGNVTVTVSTTGEFLDPDGYTVTVIGTDSRSVGINGSITFRDLGAGDHEIELTGIAASCALAGQNPRTVTVIQGGTTTEVFEVICGSAGLPYPPSPTIADITFDFSTYDRRAPGSDNWPMTWADDGHQYAAWGDGGGFGGTNSSGRVSLGVARIEGSATLHNGFNVWGGKDPENPATFNGKSYGIISIDGVFYMWVSPGSGGRNYSEARIYRSTDHGASWTGANWAFAQDEGVVLPTFIQFGQDYQGARDSYVYVYAINLKDPSDLKVQKPGEIVLLRVPKDEIMSRTSYHFFSGLDSSSNPAWSSNVASRLPVFEDPLGVGWNASGSFNPGLGRYFLITEHEETFSGNIGIFDAPEPWGPWTTALYGSEFGAPDLEARSFFWNFSNKWLSPDGTDFTLVFTGVDSNDAWNTVRGRFELR